MIIFDTGKMKQNRPFLTNKVRCSKCQILWSHWLLYKYIRIQISEIIKDFFSNVDCDRNIFDASLNAIALGLNQQHQIMYYWKKKSGRVDKS